MRSAGGSHSSLAIRIVQKFLYSNLSILLLVLSVALGAVALLVTPREEEPQIVVPLADVIVNFPGRSAAETEQLVATRLEKLLYQIDGVEYVYSMSRAGQCVVTVRFYVGEDREKSLIKLYNKIQQNTDIIPAGVTGWVVKPVEIDDVPVVTLALTSATSDDAMLRRVGEELVDRLQAVPNTAVTSVVGGRPRELRVDLRPEALAAYHVSVAQVASAIRGVSASVRAGEFSRGDQRVVVDAGTLIQNSRQLEQIVVTVTNDRPIYLRDIATVSDGPADVTSYVRFGTGPAWGRIAGEDLPAGAEVGAAGDGGATNGSLPAVTLSIAKKKGSNAVWVARDVLAKVEELKKTIVPSDMRLVVTRNMGVTADHKVNELVSSLGVAVLIVIALLTIALGWRASFVVAVAVPIVFALTLLVNLLFGYTINRVTLFALILSLGLLVDDPIVDVENIHRHFHAAGKASRQLVLEAVNEVRPPLIAATLAVILSFVPMFFITGMMGPYMRPMALNVPVAMIMSMAVSFTITPWMAYHVLGREKRYRKQKQENPASENGTQVHDEYAGDVKNTLVYRFFRPLMEPMLKRRWVAWAFMGAVGLALAGAAAMPMFRMVPLKMLPFDNKNELQLLIDLPEGDTLERTDAAVRALEHQLRTIPEVVAFESFTGVASPMDFNGLVRHYYLRRFQHQAEIRIILADKKDRVQQSHSLGLRVRDELTAVAKAHGARLKLIESPPGPPVLSTVVAEVYGEPDQTPDDLRNAAKVVAERLSREPGVVDLDTTTEGDQQRALFVVDHVKAALNGVSDADLAAVIATALGGETVAPAEAQGERNSLPLVMRLPESDRSSLDDLSRLYVQGSGGQMVPLAELGSWQWSTADKTIYHKNLRPVQYVLAEAAGRAPADIVLDVQADLKKSGEDLGTAESRPVARRTFLHNSGGIPWAMPAGTSVVFKGEGEWKITLDVFRDLGLAFAAALVAIYILLVHETGSFALPLIIMLAIPLTVIGIMPGFWLLNHLGVRVAGGYADPVFFTATGMIGMIALAGIVTRDAIILVDFIHHSLARGRTLFDAIMESRVVRLRPVLLTAGAAMLGAWPITLDPIFSGLAWALIFGLFASTLFTLFVIPVSYWLLYANKPNHGLPASMLQMDQSTPAPDDSIPRHTQLPVS
jgi:multidrug efflux pump subunit AcrB